MVCTKSYALKYLSTFAVIGFISKANGTQKTRRKELLKCISFTLLPNWQRALHIQFICTYFEDSWPSSLLLWSCFNTDKNLGQWRPKLHRTKLFTWILKPFSRRIERVTGPTENQHPRLLVSAHHFGSQITESPWLANGPIWYIRQYSTVQSYIHINYNVMWYCTLRSTRSNKLGFCRPW